MKKIIQVIFLVLVSFAYVPNSQAAVVTYKNCTELNKVYPGGVALPGAINAGGATKNQPKYDRPLYSANQKSDRDKDGIACEK